MFYRNCSLIAPVIGGNTKCYFFILPFGSCFLWGHSTLLAVFTIPICVLFAPGARKTLPVLWTSFRLLFIPRPAFLLLLYVDLNGFLVCKPSQGYISNFMCIHIHVSIIVRANIQMILDPWATDTFKEWQDVKLRTQFMSPWMSLVNLLRLTSKILQK